MTPMSADLIRPSNNSGAIK